jgi:hypothetical protein
MARRVPSLTVATARATAASVRRFSSSKRSSPSRVMRASFPGLKLATDVSVVYGEADSRLVAATRRAAVQASEAAAARKRGVRAEQPQGERVAAALSKALDDRAKAKGNLYDADCKAVGYDFSAFVMESHGFMHASANAMIRRLAAAPCDLNPAVNFNSLCSYMQRRVAIALQRGNAVLDREAMRLSRNNTSFWAQSGVYDSGSGRDGAAVSA